MEATIEKIQKVENHPNADRLDLVTVLGYQCVTQKGLYKPDDVIVFVRPDCVLPDEEWSQDYKKYSPNRIKAVMLRGLWSEGIIIPLFSLPYDLTSHSIGIDVSKTLNIKHYESAALDIPGVIGFLDPKLPRTKETRFEEIIDELPYGDLVDVSLKVDGESVTIGYDENGVKIFSRTLKYDPTVNNKYTEILKKYPQIEDKLQDFYLQKTPIYLRGELKNEKFYLFSVYLPEQGEYANKGNPYYFPKIAEYFGLDMVEMIEVNVPLTKMLLEKYSVDLKTLNGEPFEGVVVKHPNMSFRIINKHYDSKK